MPVKIGRHGREDYADPGFLGEPKYPLTRHLRPSKGRVRNAEGRLHQNRKRYRREQLREIETRIHRAGARFADPVEWGSARQPAAPVHHHAHGR
jgi:hypothetical protein